MYEKEWIFYDAALHPENPMFKCPVCRNLTFVPARQCKHCFTDMTMPKNMKIWIPEKYWHIWEDEWNKAS